MFYPGFFFDWTQIIVFPAIILAIYAQFKVQSTFNKYSQIRSIAGKTGAEVARELLNRNRLHHVRVEETQGTLSDHYDPRDQAVRLSPQVYNNSSLAALGVAAHETGHAIQHAHGYAPLQIRHSLFPIANIGSGAAIPLFFLGFIFSIPFLLKLGIFFFSFAVLFQVITLPVEFNASSRALTLLGNGRYLTSQEVAGARKVLNAAALTYIAATLVSMLELLRLIILSRLGGRNE